MDTFGQRPKLLIKARRAKPIPGQLGLFSAPVKPPSGGGSQQVGHRPPGGGWQPIPGGKHGGFRRKKGSGWEYWYKEGAKPAAKKPKAKPGMDELKAGLMDYLGKHGRVTVSELSYAFDATSNQITAHMTKLVKEGVLSRDSTGRYSIAKKQTEREKFDDLKGRAQAIGMDLIFTGNAYKLGAKGAMETVANLDAAREVIEGREAAGPIPVVREATPAGPGEKIPPPPEMTRAEAAKQRYEEITEAQVRGPGATKYTQKKAESARKEWQRLEAKEDKGGVEGGVGGLPFPVSPSDLPGGLATRAHSGSSFTPEKRAEQEQQSYVNQMRHVWETFGPKAKTDVEKRMLLEDLTAYKHGYLSRLRAKLEAQSRTLSPMITGPSKFPTRRNQKRLETERRRLDDLIDWNEKALARIKKKITKRKVEAAGGEAAVMRQKIAAMEEAQKRMKAVNKIVRSKKLTDDQKKERLASEFNIGPTMFHNLMNPDWGPKGFASYQLTNNNANIKRSKERLKELERREQAAEAVTASGGVGDTKEGDGWRWEEHHEDNRLRLFFDEKPSAEQRTALKRSGWRWSPRAGAWQRQLTDNARRSADSILGEHFGMKKSIPRLVLRIGATA